MADAPNFAKLIPGFDFLQGLVKNAGAALPSIGQWVAPTLDPDELEKRIGELRTVQFWLEQNARMLEATIQALEVQRMTLSTLKTMNVQMGDLRDTLKIRVPGVAAPAASAQDADKSEAPAATAAKSAPPAPADKPAAGAAPGAVDPLQWWGALTKQFTELAANAMKEGAGDAARKPAAPAKPSADTASEKSSEKPSGKASDKSNDNAGKTERPTTAPSRKMPAPKKRSTPRRTG
ncbi:MAG: hypothetical protein M3Y67_08950 [Pseudomonadota bacterium]|nr:hypothetical protein [Pseudomonadota bacterium]